MTEYLQYIPGYDRISTVSFWLLLNI